MTEYLRRAEAASYLRQNYGFGTAKTLAKLACSGGGPVFYKWGEKVVVYRVTDLDLWATGKMRAFAATGVPADQTRAA